MTAAPSQCSAFDAITIDHLRSTRATKWALPGQSIGAFIAEMDFGTPPAVTAALHAAVDRGCFGYAPEPLVRELQEATAERLAAAHGWSVAPADVRPVPDVISVLELALRTRTEPGTPVVVPTPAYMNFFTAIRAEGREAIEVPMHVDAGGHHTLDLPAIREAIVSSGAQLVTLCNPHNPSGRVHTRAELEAFAQMIATTRAHVFVDEIWAPLVFSGHEHVPYASISEVAASHAITAVAASKGWNIPGLKSAQAVLSCEADRAAWDALEPQPSHRSANLGMVGTIAAYRDRTGWIEETTGYLEGNARLVHEAFSQVPGARMGMPEGTYVTWIDVSGIGIDGSPSDFLLERAGVLPTDGARCGRGAEGCIRFIAAMPRPILREALERMTTALLTV